MGKKKELSKNNVSNFMWGLRTQSLTAFWRLNDTQYVTQYFLTLFLLSSFFFPMEVWQGAWEVFTEGQGFFSWKIQTFSINQQRSARWAS
jgi:hypothetical protein